MDEVQQHEPPADADFFDLLKWHMKHGTRPTQNPCHIGKEWKPKELADAVGVNQRTVGYWTKDRKKPLNIEEIFISFFSKDPKYPQHIRWRDQMRKASVEDDRLANGHSRRQVDEDGARGTAAAGFKEAANASMKPGVMRSVWCHGTTWDDRFSGRRYDLDRLDQWASDPDVRVIGIHAMGGAGKTALVTHWLRTRMETGWPHRDRFDAIFYWSFFYERDQQVCIDRLCGELAAIFSHEAPKDGDKINWLQMIFRKHDICLCLDGLEAIQEQRISLVSGNFKEGPIENFLWHASQSSKGLVILTSRFTFANLDIRRGDGYEDLPLDRLELDDGLALLHNFGLHDNQEYLRSCVEGIHGHALGLRILADILSNRRWGSSTSKQPVATLVVSEAAPEPPDTLAHRLHRLLTDYEVQLHEDEKAILERIALFPRTVKANVIAKLIPERSETDIQRHLDRLTETGVVTCDPVDENYSAHPLIREHFAPKARGEAKRAAVLLFDQPAGMKPTTIDHAIQLVDAIGVLLDAGEFKEASRMLGSHADWSDHLLTLDGGDQLALDCLLSFLGTGADEAGGESGDRRNRLGPCLEALGADWVLIQLSRLHQLMVRLSLWDDAARYAAINRTIRDDLADQDVLPILCTEAAVEAAIGRIDVAEGLFQNAAACERRLGRPRTALLEAARALSNAGFRRKAIACVEGWVDDGPSGYSLRDWLFAWTEICLTVAKALCRTNPEAAKRYSLATLHSVVEGNERPDWIDDAVRLDLAELDGEWDEVHRIADRFWMERVSNGFREDAARWICGIAKSLTKSGHPEQALDELKRGVRLTHHKSWVRHWIQLERVRAVMALGANDRRRLGQAFLDARALVRDAARDRVFSIVIDAATFMRDAADQLGYESQVQEADRFLAEAVRIRGLEPGWEPDLGPLPGEPGWLDRVTGWAITLEIRVGADPDVAIPCGALRALRDNMPSLAAHIVARHASALARSPIVAELLVALASAGQDESVACLLDAGVDVASPFLSGTTALIGAARFGRSSVVRLIIERLRDTPDAQAVIDAAESAGETALIAAASIGHGETVDILLDAGADVSMRTWYGHSAILAATEHGDLPMTRRLLRAMTGNDGSRELSGADISILRSALIAATALPDDALLDLFLDQLDADLVCDLFNMIDDRDLAVRDRGAFKAKLVAMIRSQSPTPNQDSGAPRLPDAMPHNLVDGPAGWPCCVAPADARSFGRQYLRPASSAEIGLIGTAWDGVIFENRGDFDPDGARFAEIGFLGSNLALVLIPHRSAGIAVPFLFENGDLQLLQRRNEQIYAHLTRREPGWTTESMRDLIHFFFASVSGHMGKFHLVQSESEISWAPAATEEYKARVRQHLAPLAYAGRHDDGRHKFKATILFLDALFRADVLVLDDPKRVSDLDGFLELTNEQELIEDLPVEVGWVEDLVVRF